MKNHTDQSDYFPEEKTSFFQAAESFALATGIECFVIDDKGRRLRQDAEATPEYDGCALCSLYARVGERKINCRQIHLYGSNQALRFGGTYIYFCPISLLHVSSPILKNGLLKAALVAGPVLLIPHEEYLQEEVDLSLYSSPESREKIVRAIHQIPFLSPERTSALSRQLLYTCSALSDEDVHLFSEREAQLSQQSRISEYIHLLKSMGGGTDTEYSITKEKELLGAMRRGDRAEAMKVLNEILGALFFSYGKDFSKVKARVLELTVLLSRAAIEGGGDVEEIFGLNYRYLNEIHRYTTVEDLSSWLGKILTRFTDFVFDLKEIKHADSISRALRYINQHYSEQISLEDVAGHIYFSPSYFSRFFKEETGKSFRAYLNEVRIEKSKELLMHSRAPIVEIAGLVGYDDQSYFTKVFKKVCGISPGKYRERRRVL